MQFRCHFMSCGIVFQILEKVYMQLQTFLDDPSYREEHTLHLELVATFARVGPNAEQKFRDECKLGVVYSKFVFFYIYLGRQ